MSLVGAIHVRKCDHCAETAVLSTEDQHSEFYERWHSGMHYDFCPACRGRLAVQARILDDEAAERAISSAVSKYRPAPEVNHAR